MRLSLGELFRGVLRRRPLTYSFTTVTGGHNTRPVRSLCHICEENLRNDPDPSGSPPLSSRQEWPFP